MLTGSEPLDTLTHAAMRLDDAGIDYMLTGSVAGYFYGLNRSTADIDIVIDLSLSQVTAFVEHFRDDYFVDRIMIEDAVRTSFTFNVMPNAGGKIDFIPLKDEPSEQVKFERRVPQDWHDYPIWASSAPDLVLSKLNWARSSHSHQQFSDIRTIMASGAFDEHDEYFQRWLRALGLEATLDACRTEGHDA